MNKTELREKKKELQERLEKIRRDFSTRLDDDAEEQAVQLQNRDVLLEIARVTEEELERIDEQLRKQD